MNLNRSHSDDWLTFEELLAGVPLMDKFPIALAILGVRTAPPLLLTPLEDPTVIREKTHPCITYTSLVYCSFKITSNSNNNSKYHVHVILFFNAPEMVK